MKRAALIVVAVLLLGPFAAMVPAEMGMWSGLAVFMTWPDEDYDIGSQVTVTVHVYMEGDPFDPDTVNLTAGYDEQEVNVTWSDTGLYLGTFTIDEDLVDFGYVFLSVVVEHDSTPTSDQATEWGSIDLPADNFEISFMMSASRDSYPLPGETIELFMVTTYKGEEVDADPGTVEVYTYDSVTYTDEDIAMNRVSTGHYEGSYTIPSNWTRSVRFEFEANASYTVGSTEFHASSYQSAKVTFFDVWHHNVDTGPTSAEIEYYVLDRDLHPVEGADVSLNYSYEDDDWDTHGEDLSATTDEDGMVHFTLDYADIGEYDVYVSCNVTVESGGFTEEIFDGIAVTEHSPWIDEGLFVMPPGNGILKADADVTMAMDTTMDGEPYVDQDVIVYIVGSEQVYYRDTLRTDGDGVLTVQFHTPTLPEGYDTYLELDMYFHTEGPYLWESFESWLLVTEFGDIPSMLDFLDPGTTLTVPSFRWGDTVEVVLECDDADGDEEAYAMWGMGPVDGWVFWNEITMEEWTAITVMETANFRDFDLTWSDGAFRGTMVIPHFLPEDLSITIIGFVNLLEYPDQDARAAILEEVTTLPPNQRPSVELVTEVAGGRFGGLMEVAGTADDDTGVEGVEYRIDGGAWKTATGTDTWSFELDTTAKATGAHQLEVRAFDGEAYSTLVDVTFEVDQPPTVHLNSTHQEGKRYKDEVRISGEVDDDVEVVKVEVRLDNGSWVEVVLDGSQWMFTAPTKDLKEGEHTLEFRAYDGHQYSDVFLTTFKYEKAEEEPGFGIVLALLAVMAVLVLARSRRMR